MKKDKYFTGFSKQELNKGLTSLRDELLNNDAPDWLYDLLDKAITSFKANEFSYDGATFVPERSKETIFEVAAFIHDYLNSKGIVSYKADSLMFRIMRLLNYNRKHFIYRWLFTRLTFLNIIRHKIKGTYKGKFAIELY
ncbi:hypothetical protein ACFSRZ_01710 [Pseudotenacibaculum haliotis]|uniref:DUF1353 domain-containing protein n=2 Tax=Pseudotenacibaculum haliotis TaxID=1862138 RepID=A0ABW5LMJ8_9FLAO